MNETKYNDRVLLDQEQVIERRKTAHEEKSYTCYLFECGLDKILKKVGEECTETVIAAKNLKAGAGEREALKSELVGEVADLLYHVQVMLSDVEVPFAEVLAEIDRRSQKEGNKKNMKTVDRNT